MTLLLIATAAALVACAVMGLFSARLLRSVRPSAGVMLVAGGSVALALAAGAGMSGLALALAARMTAVAADGHWSAARVAAQLPVPIWLGAGAAAAVAAFLLHAGSRTISIVVALIRSEQACRAVGPRAGSRIVIVDDDAADAVTIAGIHGRIVLSKRLLERLTPSDRRVVTAHELAHLHHRHHLYVHAADIAAAANPLLRRVPAAVRWGVERWADEEAAAATGDRAGTARALARVALIRQQLRRDAEHAACRLPLAAVSGGVPVLGAVTMAVATRVQALLVPALNRRGWRLLAVAGLVAALFAAGMLSLDNVQDVIEQATVPAHLRPHAHP